MNKCRVILLIIIFLISGIAIGCYLPVYQQKQYIPPLRITGDIAKLVLADREQSDQVKIQYRGEDLRVIQLENLIKRAGPLTKNFGVVLAGNDGLSAMLAGDELKECYLNFSSDNGWEAINLNHPVSSNIKHLKEIIVYSTGDLPERALRITSPEKNLTAVTAGQLLRDGVRIFPYFEGSSFLSVKGKEYRACIYSRKKIVYPEEIIKVDNKGRTLVIGARGETMVFNKGYLEIDGNFINYLDPETDSRIKDVRGIVLDAPVKSNKDAYHDALYYLEQGRRVMVVLLDGFGYHQYFHAIEKGFAPFLASIEPAQRALTVFKPVTNAGLAAILTGVGPARNGIYSRKQKELLVKDIFKKVEEMGKTAVNIEGNIKIINTSLEPLLNTDQNGDGYTDDEVFNTAFDAVLEEYSLVFVHFHGIDDVGHKFGDLSSQTMAKIKQIDSYLKRLVAAWPGKVIITADHGMHQEGDSGNHGLVCYQDLFIPYLITNGGKQDE